MCIPAWGAALLGLGAVILAILALIGVVYLLAFSQLDL